MIEVKMITLFVLCSISLLPNSFCLNGKQVVEYSVRQYKRAINGIKTGIEYPYEGRPSSDKWSTTGAVRGQWTAGFYPGILWQIFNYTKEDIWRDEAIKATDALFDDQFNTETHDVGFMIMSSYGNGYRLTSNSSYSKVIERAAHSLAKRFNPKVGCTRSWNTNDNQFLVIADNIMNLELLFEASELSSNRTLYEIAVSHINRTIEEHLRPDFSHYHVVAFNETTGHVIRKFTATGYADWSCWSQGQAWLIAGLTIAYRFTRSDYILKAAEGVTNYLIDRSPSDAIPFWDFDVPHDQNHRYIPRDSSSASIAASGINELFGFTGNPKYLNAFNKIMENLFSEKYRADSKLEYRIPALLVNGTADYKRGDYDRALIFGDYYFVKSLAHYL